MHYNVLQEPGFYKLLASIDDDLAREYSKRGCRHCGSRVHNARYARKPRGAPVALGAEYDSRLSYCCAARDCRRRLTPPSVRFLGRKVYLGAVVVIASALRHGITPTRYERLRELFGVSTRTVRRWRRWWLEEFPTTAFWREARGRFVPQVEAALLPLSLLMRFTGEAAERLAHMLCFISPLTTTTAQAR
jgi:hypothetical protein